MRTRKDIWKLSKIDPWHPDILWYAEAVNEMKKLPDSDPTSWVYQAAVHETSQRPNPKPRFWTQCQHSSWFFLPWHRMYLFYFEQVIKAMIAKLGSQKDADDWNLPYWNYSDPANPDATKLPPAFYASTMPGLNNPSNPLYDGTRARGNNGKSVTVNASQTDLKCLREPYFAKPSAGGGFGFCGPVTGFHHPATGGIGALDITPHGSIHGAVGGDMGFFSSAALDPIFWIHHANIDRLWNVWLKRDPSHKNPPDATWLTGLKFEFHDAAKNVVAMTSTQVADSTASPLSYQYEDESDPIPGRAGLVAPRRLAMAEEPIPEMVGATAKPVALTGTVASTSFAITPPTGPSRLAMEANAEPPQIYLNLENVSGPGHPTSYSVYLNLPPGESAAKHSELLVGNMPLFGVAEASSPNEEHSGGGLQYAYEVGDIVRTLKAKGDWDSNNVRVTFVPDYEVAARASESGTPPTVQVGRISLYKS
jgi:tyrosinase